MKTLLPKIYALMAVSIRNSSSVGARFKSIIQQVSTIVPSRLVKTVTSCAGRQVNVSPMAGGNAIALSAWLCQSLAPGLAHHFQQCADQLLLLTINSQLQSMSRAGLGRAWALVQFAFLDAYRELNVGASQKL